MHLAWHVPLEIRRLAQHRGVRVYPLQMAAGYAARDGYSTLDQPAEVAHRAEYQPTRAVRQ